MSRDSDDTGGSDRRSFLRAVGGLAAAGLASGTAAGRGRTDLSSFAVSGRKYVRVEIEPETVTLHTRRESADLRRRYGRGKGVLRKTETFDRPDPADDDLPERAIRTERHPWETYYATPEEWRAVLSERGSRVRAASGVRPGETDHPYGIWEYEAVDGGYEVAAPMNVLSPEGIGDVVEVLDDNGWTTYLLQYDRYAYNSATERFETQHRSAATSPFGFLGRTHAKFWEFEGYTSCSAHVDDAVPHDATSFDDAEAAIEDSFDGAAGWYGFDDYYATDNGSQLDHDGAATGLFSL